MKPLKNQSTLSNRFENKNNKSEGNKNKRKRNTFLGSLTLNKLPAFYKKEENKLNKKKNNDHKKHANWNRDAVCTTRCNLYKEHRIQLST